MLNALHLEVTCWYMKERNFDRLAPKENILKILDIFHDNIIAFFGATEDYSFSYKSILSLNT